MEMRKSVENEQDEGKRSGAASHTLYKMDAISFSSSFRGSDTWPLRNCFISCDSITTVRKAEAETSAYEKEGVMDSISHLLQRRFVASLFHGVETQQE
jgi:hypothetical protein